MRHLYRDTIGVLRGLLVSRRREVTDEDFRRALASLSPEVRTVYENHLLGLHRVEIAHELGISEDAASWRLSDARRQLRSLLFSSRAARRQP